MGDAMTQWDGDAAGGMSQCHWVGLGWVGQSTWGPVQVLVEGGLVPGGFTGCACAEIQCGSLIRLFTGLQSSPRLMPLGASHPSGVAPAGLVSHRWWLGELLVPGQSWCVPHCWVVAKLVL